MKFKLKSTASLLKYNGKEYGPGDKVEMPKEEAIKIKHHLEEGEDVFGQEPAKEKEIDDPNRGDA
jgi:hypothetical protein